MNINLEYYKVFYYVCQEGSLTAAAQRLCISQPAVSQAVRQLEKEAGQQKPAANPFRNVAQSVRAAGLYPAWRGFESFRSDLPGLRVLHPDIPGA